MMTRRCLATRFGLLGAFVGKFPLSIAGFFLLALLVPSLLAFWLGLRLQIGLDEGFVPGNAPSRREISMQKQFFGETEQSKEWYMALFGIARPHSDGTAGNMLNSANYDEFNAFYERVTRKMALTGPRGNFTYSNICSPLCDINDQLQKLMENSWLAMLGQVKIRYPVSKVLSYDVNIGKVHVFNRTVNKQGDLVGAEYIAFYFTSFIRDELRGQELALFEQTVAEEAKLHNLKPNTRVELITHGSNSVQGEMSRGVLDAARNKLIGLALGATAFLGLHAFSGWLHSQFPARRLLLAFFCVVLLPVAFFASLALLSLVGFSVNLLHFTSPLSSIALVITVHGTFQLADAFCRLLAESKRKQFTASERLASTFEQIGPSLLSTQFGPFIGFALLSPFLPAQHYRALCLGLSLLLTICLFLQLLFFAPLLARFCHHHADHVRFINGAPIVLEFGPNDPVLKKPSIAEHPPIVKLRAKNGHELIPAAVNGNSKLVKKREQRTAPRKQLRLIFGRTISCQFAIRLICLFADPLANFLRSMPGRFAIFIFTVLCLLVALFRSIPSIKNDMDYRHLLPRGSPAQHGFDLMDTIWADFLQILYIVHKPPDFEDPAEFGEFKDFLSAATAFPQSLPPEAHMSWLFDYHRDQLHSNLFQHLSPKHSHEAVNMSKFERFITGFPYRAWQSGVHYSLHPVGQNESRISIDQMLVMIAYNDTMGLAGKRSLINQCREVAKRFPQFRITVFDTDLRTADIMDNVEPFLWGSIAGLIAIGWVVSLMVLWHFGYSLLALFSSISTFAMFFGFGQLAGFHLDLLTGPTTIAIGAITAQLGAQFLSDLLSCWAKEDPFRHGLALCSGTMAKTLLVWLALAMPPLCLSEVPYFGLQARLLLLGALLAFWHGLFLVPCLAGMLPKAWIH